MLEEFAASIVRTNSTHDLLLSYASLDDEIAADLERRLQRNGLTVWRDRQSILAGTQWSKEIEHALNSCKVLLALVTPNFCRSIWTPYEVERVRGRTGIFAPVRVVPCLWQGSLPDFLADLQAIDFRTNRRDAFVRLVRELRHILEGMEEGEQAKELLAKRGVQLLQAHMSRRRCRSVAKQVLSYASHKDLEAVLRRRGLPVARTSDARKDELLGTVQSLDDAMDLIADVFTVARLKNILRAEHQPVSGTKLELVHRLINHFDRI